MEKEEIKQSMLEDRLGVALAYQLGMSKNIENFEKDLEKQSRIFFNDFVVKDKNSSSEDSDESQNTNSSHTNKK